MLSRNPNAIKLLCENINNINIWHLTFNSNIDKIINFIENSSIIFNEETLFKNQFIITYDYDKIKETKKELNEEILIKSLHPKRMLKLMEQYGEDIVYDCYFNDD
jgi:hypothetical protein